MKIFGETLKKLRRQKDMTQEQLAEYVNVSPHGNFIGYYKTMNEPRMSFKSEGESKDLNIWFLILGFVFCGIETI